MEIRVRNVNEALPLGLDYLVKHGIREDSRNGPVLSSPEPVLTIYERPQEKVLMDPIRDANPFFHFFEALWMLAGRNDVAFVYEFVKRMALFSDDGHTFHAAYGHRWRLHFSVDQLDAAVAALQRDPLSRRVVIAIHDPNADIGAAARGGKDTPCNLTIALRKVAGGLDLTVFCRSNDLVWGAYGANAVHFAVLQEYLAMRLGCHVGRLFQLSNNLHVYLERPDVQRLLTERNHQRAPRDNPYPGTGHVPFLVNDERPSDWETDLRTFFTAWTLGTLEAHRHWRTSFFAFTVAPLYAVHRLYASGADYGPALEQVSDVVWQRAARGWLSRRRLGGAL